MYDVALPPPHTHTPDTLHRLGVSSYSTHTHTAEGQSYAVAPAPGGLFNPGGATQMCRLM
jgi:hypothetical protein